MSEIASTGLGAFSSMRGVQEGESLSVRLDKNVPSQAIMPKSKRQQLPKNLAQLEGIETFMDSLGTLSSVDNLLALLPDALRVFNTKDKVHWFCACLDYKGKVPRELMSKVLYRQSPEKKLKILLKKIASKNLLSVAEMFEALGKYGTTKSLQTLCEGPFQSSDLIYYVENLSSKGELPFLFEKFDENFDGDQELMIFCDYLDAVKPLPPFLLHYVFYSDAKPRDKLKYFLNALVSVSKVKMDDLVEAIKMYVDDHGAESIKERVTFFQNPVHQKQLFAEIRYDPSSEKANRYALEIADLVCSRFSTLSESLLNDRIIMMRIRNEILQATPGLDKQAILSELLRLFSMDKSSPFRNKKLFRLTLKIKKSSFLNLSGHERFGLTKLDLYHLSRIAK